MWDIANKCGSGRVNVVIRECFVLYGFTLGILYKIMQYVTTQN